MACACNVFDTVQLLRSLGFIIHPDKSVLEPTRRIQYLRVIIDSELMTVTLTPERSSDMISCCLTIVKKETVTIRDLAKVIGKIVASFPAVMYGPLHCKQLEKEKKTALIQNAGRFDRRMTLSSQNRLVGLVVKASASRAGDPGFESRLRQDFFGVKSYQWLKNWHSSGYPARRLAI